MNFQVDLQSQLNLKDVGVSPWEFYNQEQILFVIASVLISGMADRVEQFYLALYILCQYVHSYGQSGKAIFISWERNQIKSQRFSHFSSSFNTLFSLINTRLHILRRITAIYLEFRSRLCQIWMKSLYSHLGQKIVKKISRLFPRSNFEI